MKWNFFQFGAWVIGLAAAVFWLAPESWWLGTAQGAVGDLVIDWGDGLVAGDPIFTVPDMVPGQAEVREVEVTNNDSLPRTVGVRATATSAGLADALQIVVAVNGADIYGPQLLSQFFIDAAGPGALELGELAPGESMTVAFGVSFVENADNFFQDASVVFDITLGLAGAELAVPAECEGIVFVGEPIVGSAGSDSLRGTSGNDLIFGLEGSDSIRGLGGDDCIVGGEGSDSLRGGRGDDVLLGGEGEDSLRGDRGADVLLGGDQSDSLRGGRGDDVLLGGEGEDSARGQRGTDTCEAESERSCEL